MKIQRPNIKINKTWLMLIVAILLSLLTTWLAMQYLKFKEQSIEAELSARAQRSSGTTVAVVVPIRPLQPGMMLDESVVASRNVPVDFTYSDTITVAQFDAYKGHALLRPVEPGKPLRTADVREIFADFSGSLKPGTRAITINVDEINSVSHMIEPGNLVDLMLIITPEGETSTTQTVVPFLDQIKVLATGQKVTQDDPSVQVAPERRRVSYSNLTLEVTPTQGARLALASELGKIRAVLRNEKDRQQIDYEAVDAGNLLEDIRERARRAAAARPRRVSTRPEGYVEYIIGGKGSADAVAPALNIPLPPGFSLTPPAGTAAPTQAVDAGAAGAAAPQTVSQLIQLGLGGSAAPAK